MRSLFPDICTDHLTASRDFYVLLFDFTVIFEIDWYIQLQSPQDKNLQIAFVAREHSSVPQTYQQTPQGVIITVEVSNANKVHEKAKALKLTFAQEIRNEDWGQRHFMLVDPNNLLVDIVQMTEPKTEFLKQHGLM